MSVRKVCVVITARPSYSRIRTALQALKANDAVELQIIATGSFVANRFGHVIDIMKADGFEPNWSINSLLEADNLTTAPKTTAIQISELSSAFHNLKPDVVVTIADRYETMATAIAASYMNIPLAHIQGGEVTGNIDEKVRHAITKLADLHLVSNQDAFERVKRLGEREEIIHITGCPSIDIAKTVMDDKEAWTTYDPFARKRFGGVGEKFNPDADYIVVMKHPVTSHYQEARRHMEMTLNAVHALEVPTIVFWPNPDSGTEGVSEAVRAFREIRNPRQFFFLKNLPPDDFLRLMLRTRCLIGNSSVGIRECSYLGVPVVNIGERQRGRVRGQNVIDVPMDTDAISSAIVKQMENGRYPSDEIYGDGRAGEAIASVLASADLGIDKVITY